MKILFTICGRAGSKGIKNKNILNFLGNPLINYSLSAIKLYCSKHKENKCDTVISTNSQELVSLVTEYIQLETYSIERAEGLAQDDTPKITVVADCLKQMEVRVQDRYDMVIDLDITSPLRVLHDIENLVEMKQNNDYDLVFSVTEARRNPYFNMVKRVGDEYKKIIESDFTSRQQAPEVFDMNASLYAYSPAYLKSGKKLFDCRCGVIKMFDTAVLDLDNPQDFALMEVIADYLFHNNKDFEEIFNGCKGKG